MNDDNATSDCHSSCNITVEQSSCGDASESMENITNEEDQIVLETLPSASNNTKATSSISRKRRRRIASELEQLTRNEHRKTTNPGVVQLYASEFDNTNIESNNDDTGPSSRPKRRIKAVQRYVDTRYTHAEQVKLFEMQGKCGTGFLCPLCPTHLSYDRKSCYNCGAKCCYQPGVGVVLLKDREEISNVEELASTRKVEIDAPKQTMNGEKNRSTINGMNSSTKSTRISSQRSTRTKVKDSNQLIQGSKRVSLEWAQKTLSHAVTHECEACMQLFLPSYLQRHRKRSHNISSEFGCPYCCALFSSMSKRDDHIKEKHPKKPIHLTDKEKEMTKLYLYDCPRCETSLTYGDLRDHLDKVHDEDINFIKDMVTCSCPFCLVGDKPLRNTFTSTDTLMNHIRKDHIGCKMKGEKLKLNGHGIIKRNTRIDEANINFQVNESSAPKQKSASKRISKRVTERASKSKDLLEKQEQSTNESIPDESLQDDNIYWFALLPDVAIRESKVKGINYGPGEPIDDVIESIEERIEMIQQRMNLIVKHGDKKLEEDYIAENKLYIKGIRERTNKAESEALEKFMYKDKCEERQRWLDYESRTKKKSPIEIETEELIYRPVKFVSSKTSKRSDKCPLGVECDLCNGWYATNIITKDEILASGDDVQKAIEKIVTKSSDKPFIPSKGFRRITDDDLPDDESYSTSSSRVSKGRTTNEIPKLLNLKHTLEFIRDFNKGI